MSYLLKNKNQGEQEKTIENNEDSTKETQNNLKKIEINAKRESACKKLDEEVPNAGNKLVHLLKDHNIATYMNMEEILDKGNKILINQPTGTGKSYLAAQYIYNFGERKKILYLTPGTAITSHFEEILKDNKIPTDNITFSTYQNLKKFKDDKFDIIICDEAHHLGDNSWKDGVSKILENQSSTKLIGLTATINRYDGFDITEFFDENVIKLTLLQAYEREILPIPNYFLCEVSYNNFGDNENSINERIRIISDKLRELENSSDCNLSKDKIQELKNNLNSLEKSYDEIKKEIPTDDRIGDEVIYKVLTTLKNEKLATDPFNSKLIVFCPPGEVRDGEGNKEEKIIVYVKRTIEESLSKCANIKNVKTYYMHSDKYEKENNEALKNFKNDKSEGLKILFNIGMISEGVHIDDLNGVVMIRPTNSEVVYLQQLGRILDSKKTSTPFVIDCCCNYMSMAAKNKDMNQYLENYLIETFGDSESEDPEEQEKERNTAKELTKMIHFFLNAKEVNPLDLLERLENFEKELKIKAIPVQRFIKTLKEIEKERPEIYDSCCDKDKKFYSTAPASKSLKELLGDEEYEHFKDNFSYTKAIFNGKQPGYISDEDREFLEEHVNFNYKSVSSPSVQRFIKTIKEIQEERPEIYDSCCDKDGKFYSTAPASESLKKLLGDKKYEQFKNDFKETKRIFNGKTRRNGKRCGNITDEDREFLEKYVNCELNQSFSQC
jgi:superfamily II DNA or RNA helicase